MITEQLKIDSKEPFEQEGSSIFLNGGMALLCFALAFIAAFGIQLTSSQPRMLLMLDSGHFFLTCQLIFQHLPEFLCLNLQKNSILADALMQDGPVLPLVPAVVYSLAGMEPLSTNWQVVAAVQCTYHAFSASLVYLMTSRLLRSIKWAMLAGIVWGVNPAALVNCGRFLTEGLALVLILAAAWMMVEASININNGIKRLCFSVIAGIFQGLLLLTKPPLLFACGLSIIAGWASFSSVKLRTQFLAAMVAGVIVVIFPWAIVTKQVVGEIHVIPKRSAVHNLVKGLNYQADAWQSFPQPPLTAIYSNWFDYDSGIQELWASGQAVFMANPTESIWLAVRKIPRLFFLPWNDFDVSVFYLDSRTQVFLHYLLIISAMLGSLVFVFNSMGYRDSLRAQKGIVVGYISLAVIIGHFAYLPFEAMPRYWFSAMPFMAIFAVLFWHFLAKHRAKSAMLSLALAFAAISFGSLDLLPYTIAVMNSTDGGILLEFIIKASLVIGSICALAVSFKWASIYTKMTVPVIILGCIFVLWASIYTHKSPREWKCLLQPGQVASRSVYVPQKKLLPSSAFLILDTDKSILQSDILINDIPVKTHPFGIFDLNPEQFFVSGYVRVFSAANALTFDDIRQWRVVPVPVSVIKYGALNKISIRANKNPVLVYGDYEMESAKRRYPPKFFDFSPDKYIHDPYRRDGRLINYTGIPIVNKSSELVTASGTNTGDLSSDGGIQSGEYRMFLAMGQPSDSAKSGQVEQSTTEPAESIVWKKVLTTGDFDLVFSSSSDLGTGEIRMNKSILRYCKSNSITIAFPEPVLENVNQCESVRVRITGKIRSSTGKKCKAGICVSLQGEKFNYILPATPYSLEANKEWSEFAISNIVPISIFPQRFQSVTIGLYPGPWESVAAYGPTKNSADSVYKDLVLEIGKGDQIFVQDIHDLFIK